MRARCFLRPFVAAALLLATQGLGGAAHADPLVPHHDAPSLAPDVAPLATLVADPAPPALINGRHFLVSNEHQPDYFHEAVAGRGGLVLGVGAEQNYLFAGWARAEALVLLDFDEAVVDLHAAYAVFFQRAEDPRAFLRAWTRAGRADARRWLTEDIADEDQQRRTLHVFELVAEYVSLRLSFVALRCRQVKLACFVDDVDQYRHLSSLFRARRVGAVRGDLKGDRAVRSVAEAARRLGMPVRVVYLSNVEDYFGYAATRLDDNLLELPFDARSVILRTTSNQGGPHDFRYLVQDATDFAAWMGQGGVGNLGAMLQRAAPRPTRGAWRIGPPR